MSHRHWRCRRASQIGSRCPLARAACPPAASRSRCARVARRRSDCESSETVPVSFHLRVALLEFGSGQRCIHRKTLLMFDSRPQPLCSCRCHQAVDRVGDGRRIGRLRQMQLVARGERLNAILRIGIGRHGHGGRGANRLRRRSDPPDQFEAVAARHADVRDKNVGQHSRRLEGGDRRFGRSTANTSAP